MTPLKHLSRLLIVALLIASCATDPHAEKIAAIESNIAFARVFGDEQVTTLEERMAQLNVPAVSIAVAIDGKIAWARAYGLADVDEDRPATTETLFQAASISKPVAAAAMLAMVEDGLIDLDTDVNQYLTSWKLPENEFTQSEKVTLRRIVNHTAGLTVWGFPGYGRGETIPTAVDVLDGKGNTDPVRVYKVPGESWQYSGGGYTIMQQLMSDVAGRPFPEVVQAAVLEPAGMRASGYLQPLPEDLHEQAATGYRDDGAEVDSSWHVYPEMAAAGLWTTPSDLLRFAMTIHADLNGAGKILDAETVEAMLTAGDNNHGLGPGITDDGLRFGHGGANEGYRCFLTYFKDGRGGVAVMTNSDSGGRLAHELNLSVAREYGWPGIEPEVIEVVQLDEESLEALAGTYVFDRGEVEVRPGEGRLIAKPSWSDGEIVLMPTSPTEFAARDEGMRVAFETEDGRGTVLIVNGGPRGERK